MEALETAILGHPHLQRAREIAKAVMAAHLPVRFPEVFRRDRPGFDCILGNPPWEKLKVEEHSWWALRFPGLRSMGQQDKNDTIAALKQDRLDLLAEYEADVASAKSAANILAAGPFPGLRAATDTDLFTAFAWRFWHEMRDGGFTGVVLPRTAFAGSGAEEWRRTVLADGAFADVTFLTNTARWAFDMEPRYTVGLVTARKTDLDHRVSLRGPFSSYEKYVQGEAGPAAVFAGADVAGWTERAAFPLLPDDRGTEVFAQLRRHPSLASDVGDWHFQPLRELHTSDNRNFYDFHLTTPEASHTLPVWSGAAFNLWDPTSGPPYAFANPKVVVPFLQERRHVSARRADTPFTGLAARDLGSEDSLPMMAPRIAFRDVCRATDSRTMICALVPPGIALVHKAPYLLQQRGTKADEAYLLGIMSSLPFDWYARRFVEITMSYGLLNAFPVPRVDQGTGSVVGPDGHVMDLAGDFRPIRTRLIETSAQLAAADKRYSEWLADVGAAPAVHFGAEARQDLIDEVNALAGLLYGLTAEHLATVFETFHAGWNHAPRLAATLAHYSKWSKMTGIAARKGRPDDAG